MICHPRLGKEIHKTGLSSISSNSEGFQKASSAALCHSTVIQIHLLEKKIQHKKLRINKSAYYFVYPTISELDWKNIWTDIENDVIIFSRVQVHRINRTVLWNLQKKKEMAKTKLFFF